jgi:hypothetical protein
MYLRRFADERGNLTMVDRDGDLPARPVSVNNACNESGYYSIPARDLEEHARDGHDPELIEKLFAEIEAKAAVVLERIVREHVLPERGSAERFDLALHVSQQITRGWGFRARIEEHVNVLGAYFRGLPRASAATAGVTTLLEPLTATVLAVIVLGDRPTWLTWAGAVLLLLSVVDAARHGSTAGPQGHVDPAPPVPRSALHGATGHG